MNTNINRHRSPTQKSTQPITKNLNYLNYNPQVQRLDKNNMHSSTQGSTKEEQSSSEQHNIAKQPDYVSPINLGFYKVKKQQIHLNKPETNFHVLKTYHSEKAFHTKIQTKAAQTKQKKSPQKLHDYFGFKNPPQKILKDKGRLDYKLSDSGQSQMSHNSTQSNKVQNKALKFLSKKLEKKHSEQNILKNQKHRFGEEPQKHVPLFLEQRAEQKKLLTNFSPRNQIILQQQTARKQSPAHHVALSPSKKQDISNYGNDNGIYKRSSLTPQNKMQVMRHQHHDVNNIVKNTLTPKKISPLKYTQKEHTPSKLNIQPTKNKNYNFYPTLQNQNKQQKQKKLEKNSDFSFSKQRLQASGGNFSQRYIPKSFHAYPTLTIYSVTNSASSSGYPTTFVLLQTLTENRSSSIYKVFHPATTIVYCLKKCAVNRNNIDQLIIEHKVSTYLVHSNLVRAYESFYDQQNIYLLMQYMQGRSLLNKNNRNYLQKQKAKEEGNKWDQSSSYIANKSSFQAKNINRMSFRQRPKILDHPLEGPDQPRYSNGNVHPNTYLYPLHAQTERTSQSHIQKLAYIKNVLQQILQGLRYLHQNNIIHRDLKPDNIFVSHNSYKIGDFGSCTYKNSQEYIGTLDYAAPEIMLRKNYDKSIDLWSFGCIAYQLDVGRPPFYHYDRNQTIRRITNVQYDQQLISDLGLRKFIGKLLLKNGNMRIDANQALMEVKMLEINQNQNNNVFGNNNNNNGGGNGYNSYNNMGYGGGRHRISGK